MQSQFPESLSPSTLQSATKETFQKYNPDGVISLLTNLGLNLIALWPAIQRSLRL